MEFLLHGFAFAFRQAVQQWPRWHRLKDLDPLRPCNLNSGTVKASWYVARLVDNQRGSAVICLALSSTRRPKSVRRRTLLKRTRTTAWLALDCTNRMAVPGGVGTKASSLRVSFPCWESSVISGIGLLLAFELLWYSCALTGRPEPKGTCYVED
jgi:hypothetical protein